MKIAKILQLAGRKLTWTHRESKQAEQQQVWESLLTDSMEEPAQKPHVSRTGFASSFCSTAEVFKNGECATVHEHTEHLRKLGQAEPLPAALPDFSLVLCTKAALHSAALGQLFHLHTTHTNMSWHTLIALNQVSICMHKPPRRALMNLPSNVYASTTIRTN